MLTKLAIEAMETGWVPDALIRLGIRRLLAERIRSFPTDKAEFVRQLKAGPLAVHTDTSKKQHYEEPPEFFHRVLGPRLKYSSAFFPSASTTLAEAEEAMLALTVERAEITDGMRILDLGCGWGSLSLWLGEKFPNSEIVGLSHSNPQREVILAKAMKQGLTNVQVSTQDILTAELPGKFDRIVSVEMFEHLRNYDLLFAKVAGWLEDNGKLFVHIFSHKESPYFFESEGDDNWMGKHFFSGGIMPSQDLFSHFTDSLRIEKEYRLDGTHYARTCEAWAMNLARERETLLTLLPQENPNRYLQRWKIFFLACAELFAYNKGQEWGVSHYLLRR